MEVKRAKMTENNKFRFLVGCVTWEHELEGIEIVARTIGIKKLLSLPEEIVNVEHHNQASFEVITINLDEFEKFFSI
ncbi:MAG: hypothetical protein ACD_11C00053G0012 [uncultured bacterium]|nr:MAG: hypothetical protein ACD_11C00053G0012 [uncultured bacterium]